jgi:hypothetical protein
MSEWLTRIDPVLMIPILPMLCGTLIAIIAIISHAWRKHRQSEMEMALKQDMLNRGMSAEDIERVIVASRPR